MRSYSKLGWAGLVVYVLLALYAFGAGIWFLNERPDSLIGLVLIGFGVFVLAGLRDASVLFARGMSKEDKSDELIRTVNSHTSLALTATGFTVIGVAAGGEVGGTAAALAWGCWGFALIVVPQLGFRLLLRPGRDDPERPRQPALAVLIASMVVWMFALIGFFAAVVYAFAGGSGTHFVLIWLVVSAIVTLGAFALFLLRPREDAAG